MDEKEISAHKGRRKAAEKFQMSPRHRLDQLPYQLNLLGCIRIERRLDTVGHQGLQAPELPPVLKFGRVAMNRSRALLLSEVATSWGEHHLILVVRTSAGDLVLDNLTSQIRPWTRAP